VHWEILIYGKMPELIEAREIVARWMIAKGLATGHGDTIEDLLEEAYWQIIERGKQGG
jgi:hypothetical protein